MMGEKLTIKGQVQGVGFRPTVWRIAEKLNLTGNVKNTAQGVEINIWGENLAQFEPMLQSELPQLASIDAIESQRIDESAPKSFEINTTSDLNNSALSSINVTADAACCDECLQEMRDPFENRYWYPFTNCTNCGPRFSIQQNAPYDRANTTMRSFEMCKACASEYENPLDRRFHAQPIACHVCGPKAWLEHLGGGSVNAEAFSMMDDVDAAGGALMNGHIVAVKGLGGVHLACDATKENSVNLLRKNKQRKGKAFALMARDIDIIRKYAKVSEQEEALLKSVEAPIVLLKAHKKAEGETLPSGVAPNTNELGFMLPYTPLHHLMLRRMKRPVIMTSGNISGQPQCTTNEQVREKLKGVAEFALLHDRDIANRIDDSVLRLIDDRTNILRRARGYAPKPIKLPHGFNPDGFDKDTQLLSLGAELKNTFCFVKGGQAVLSQHMGDLENIATLQDVEHNLDLYQKLYEFEPSTIVVDQHSEYLSSKMGHEIADNRPVIQVQHHHAHIASCMVDNNLPLDTKPILGVALDGLGMGDDGTLWGGEFMACTYNGYKRLGTFKPVALPGGAASVREPWRNLYAHIMAQMGWAEFKMNFADLEVFNSLNKEPIDTLQTMIEEGVNAPLSSSCGRLFDAAAALCGLAWHSQNYEGEAAQIFESVLDKGALNEPADLAYPFSIPLMGGKGMPYIEPLGVWRAMLGDMVLKTPIGTMSARFHRGLANAITQMVQRLTADSEIETVALTGGCFQNETLFKLVSQQVENLGLNVICHSKVPSNDGGIALGQSAIALATLIHTNTESKSAIEEK